VSKRGSSSTDAAFGFREPLGGRVWFGVLAIAVAGSLLGWQPTGSWELSPGVLGILAASLLWGFDNNLTRVVSAGNPVTIVAVKGLGAGTASLAIAAAAGAAAPPVRLAVSALALGAVSYGVSVGLFVRALRDLGAARTSAMFGMAPFFGAALSWLVLREPLGPASAVAFSLMGLGAAALLGERHRHEHFHPELIHEHSHTHDDGHHDHNHEPGKVIPGVRHSHPHRHAPMTHAHDHAPDIHHRHPHGRE
jgi:drug/metabolite transporter (DMT)-like permease